uniref:Uncharacterized protein n=1 Tax=Rhizophora mucronata TaxID=61149 RepID=A0A2P2R3C7_RHIMU
MFMLLDRFFRCCLGFTYLYPVFSCWLNGSGFNLILQAKRFS